MKIICTTVVRAAKQGDIHGGLYVVDIDSEEVVHYAPYQEDFINDILEAVEQFAVINQLNPNQHQDLVKKLVNRLVPYQD